jgi:DNA polymerase I-like protein with 3'-5' exonuclease and polymerase domains
MAKMDMGLATRELDMFVDDNVKDILDLHPWMQDKKFELLTDRKKIEDYIYRLIENGIAALDLETTSLNTRVMNGEIIAKLVGICLAPNSNESAYIPVGHEGYDDNVSYDFAVHMLKLLCMSDCRLIFHNFKYDGQVLYNHDIKILDPERIEDTMLMAAVEDASRKNKGLKYLSENLLKRPMLEISGLGVEGSKKKIVSFTDVSPKKAVIYGGSDAMNTFALFEYLTESLNEQDPNGNGGPWLVYNKIEKRAVFPVMEMERNLVRMNRGKLEAIRDEIHEKVKDCIINIYKLAGREFDIASGKQLGEVLFDEMGVRYPEKEKNDNGTYKTDEKTLEKVKDESPLVQYVLNYRSYQKTLSTYVNNFLKNMDENDEVKFQLNQVQADTGRFSASGGAGLEKDGYSGVNCQNISTYNKKDPTSFDLRDCVEAHKGFKIVAVDYSGEELRIAANLSKESKWVNEFNNGTGDIHSITGRAIHNKENITKAERSTGKVLNFLTLYGGGAKGFAQQAKIPIETAKKMQYNFFKSLPGLKKWIDTEAARSRKRGYSKTAFGRRRNLRFFYDSTDNFTKSQGDRRAVNSAVQGCLQPHERCLTDKGYLPIIEIQKRLSAGQALKVWTGISWKDFTVLNRGACQWAQIKLINGMVLDCDTRHEVLTVGKNGYEFKKYEDLDRSTNVCVSVPDCLDFGEIPEKNQFSGGCAHNSKDIILRDERDFEFISYFMGILIGDGNTRGFLDGNKCSVTISFGKSKLEEYYQTLQEGFNRIGVTLSPYRKTTGAKGESYQADISSKALIELLKYYGYNPSNSKTKRVPTLLYECPVFMRRAFIKGCLMSDGSRNAKNRYGIHNKNKRLLQDIQLLAWTIGLASYVKDRNDGSSNLLWSDLSLVEETFGFYIRKRKTGGSMLLPDFLYSEIYDLIKDKDYKKNNNDKVLVSKLKLKKKILVPTVIKLLKKYNCDLPVLYYHYPLKEKNQIDRVSETYTLSVDSPLHRFDSAGIISKNTGADVIKIALYRVWKWIYDNGYENDVKILMPVHDEIVFEVKGEWEKLDYYIPELARIMKLDDLVEKLGWDVPFELDAEFGDTWKPVYDYYKIKAGKQEYGPAKDAMQNHEFVPAEEKEDKLEEKAENLSPSVTGKEENPEEVSKKNLSISDTPSQPVRTNEPIKDAQVEQVEEVYEQQSTTVNDAAVHHFVVTIRDQINKKADNSGKKTNLLDDLEKDNSEAAISNGSTLLDRVDGDDYFVYPISKDKLDFVISEQFATVLKLLVHGNEVFVGPKKRIKIKLPDGQVAYPCRKKISIDAFVALCTWLNI